MLVKLVLVGELGTGKGQILSGIASDDLQGAGGASFATRTFMVNGVRVRLQIW